MFLQPRQGPPSDSVEPYLNTSHTVAASLERNLDMTPVRRTVPVSHNHVYLVSSASAPCLVILEYLIISGPIRDSLWWMRSILLEDNIVSASVRTRVLVFPVQESHSPGQQDAAYRVPGRHFQTGIL